MARLRRGKRDFSCSDINARVTSGIADVPFFFHTQHHSFIHIPFSQHPLVQQAATMPAATPAKRILAESNGARVNQQPSPRPLKKTKFDDKLPKHGRTPVKMAKGPNSSQPKSQFEEEVLEKMTQDMENLKENSTERDQQWARPSLGEFNEMTTNLCFQQIEAEEGVLNGGKATIKLFGVTEVALPSQLRDLANETSS